MWCVVVVLGVLLNVLPTFFADLLTFFIIVWFGIRRAFARLDSIRPYGPFFFAIFHYIHHTCRQLISHVYNSCMPL